MSFHVIDISVLDEYKKLLRVPGFKSGITLPTWRVTWNYAYSSLIPLKMQNLKKMLDITYAKRCLAKL